MTSISNEHSKMKEYEIAVDQFIPFLARETGLTFRSDRIHFLTEKAIQRMEECGAKDLKGYFDSIRYGSDGNTELRNLVDLLTVGETYFFRNNHHFKALTEYALPKILEMKRSASMGRGQPLNLRVWCAGCSTGEEPYSIAMALRETVPDFEGWDISILATDINRRSLMGAETARYGMRSISHVPKGYLEKYFIREGREWVLAESIKDMVEFRSHNLVQDAYDLDLMTGLDLIFCRNVTIYFDLETTKTIMSHFVKSLAPDGFLFVGHAETLWNICDELAPIELPGTFIYRKSKGGVSHKRDVAAPVVPIAASESSIVPPPFGDEGGISKHAEFGTEQAPVESTDINVNRSIGELMKRGTSLADQGNFEDALTHVQEAIRKDSLYAPAYYLAGVILEKMGAYEDAAREFRRVLYVDQGLTICYFNLGNIFRFLGRVEDAKREYGNCLKFLEREDEDAEIQFTDGMTVGVLSQAVHRALDILNSVG